MFADVGCDFHRQTLPDDARDEIVFSACVDEVRLNACPDRSDLLCVLEVAYECRAALLELKAKQLRDFLKKKCHRPDGSST